MRPAKRVANGATRLNQLAETAERGLVPELSRFRAALWLVLPESDAMMFVRRSQKLKTLLIALLAVSSNLVYSIPAHADDSEPQSSTETTQPAPDLKFRNHQQEAPSQPTQPLKFRSHDEAIAAPQPAQPLKFRSHDEAIAAPQPAQPNKFRAHEEATAVPQLTIMPLVVASPTGNTCPKPASVSGIAQAQNLSQAINKTLVRENPALRSTASHIDDVEVIEYNERYDAYMKNAAKTETPAQEPAPAPQNDFVTKLLNTAKHEANVRCRFIGGRTKCTNKPKGACLQGVRMAFQKASGEGDKGGWITDKKGHSVAKDAGPHLKRYGYHKSELKDPLKAPVGAVIIYTAPQRAKAGHIEIKGTDGYYSDFYNPYPINDKRGLGIDRRVKEIWIPN